MLTHKRLLEILSYNQNTGVFTWKLRVIRNQWDKTWNTKHAGKITGYTRHNGYKVINISFKEYSCSRLAWFYVNGVWPKGEVDHINGKRADNRIKNLRESTRSENASNRSAQRNNTSGFKGVWKRKGLNIWVAEINNMKLGHFKTPEAASKAYAIAAKQYHKDFAKL